MSLSKTGFIQWLPETAQITSFIITSVSAAYSASFSPLRHRPNCVREGSLKSRFLKTCWEKTKPGVL